LKHFVLHVSSSSSQQSNVKFDIKAMKQAEPFVW